MKTTLLVAVAALASVPANAQVTTIFSDSFNYPNGPATVVSGGIWTAHSDAGNTPVQITNGAVVLLQGTNGREDISAPLNDILSVGEIFTATFDLILTGGSQNGYFASFMADIVGAVAARLFVVPPIAGGDYSLGISNNGTAPDLGAVLPIPFLFGMTYQPSITIDADSGLGRLVVEGASVSTTSATAFAISTFAFRQGSGNSTQVIDNLIVTRAIIPEPGTLIMLLSGVGLLGIARRRNCRN